MSDAAVLDDPVMASTTWAEVLQSRAVSGKAHQVAFTWLGTDPGSHDASITYADLDCRARSIAAVLQHTAPAGERALLLLPPGLDFIAALFGCFYAGWTAVPAYPPPLNTERLERVRSLASDAQPRLALTTAATLARIAARLADEPSLRFLEWLAVDGELAATDDWDPPSPSPTGLAILQYTSGSTAAPRGVMLTHANLLHNAAQIQRRFGAGPESRGVIWLPPYHDMGLVGGILEGVFTGFPIALLAPVAFLQRPRRWLEAITRTHATISGGPNFAYELCVARIQPADREGLDLSSWTVAFNGAEPVRPATLDRFVEAFAPYGFNRSAFYPCYGLAEATLMVTGGGVADPPLLREISGGRTIVGCGQSIDDQSVVIVDPVSRMVCAHGEVGEVWVAGPSVADGYWHQRLLTDDVFGGRLPDGTGPFLRTGDLGFLHERELFITGRAKAVLILGGRKFQAENIEATLAASPRAGRPDGVIALGVDANGQERLVIIQEVRSPTDPQATVTSIRERIASAHQIPVWAVVLTRPGGIPRTSSGKLQRATSQALFAARQFDSVYEWKASWS